LLSPFLATPNVWKTAFVVVAYWATLMLFAIGVLSPHVARLDLLTLTIALGLPIFGLVAASVWRIARTEPSQLAYKDELTGAGNRRAFAMHSKSMTRGAKAGSRALVLVDIDGLKTLNDECGHQAGDELLVTVAQRLSLTSPRLYRIGGDEFAILIDRGEGETVVAHLQQLEAFNMKFASCGHEHKVCFSYGYASLQEHESFESLFRRADDRLIGLKRQLYASGDFHDRRADARDTAAAPVAEALASETEPTSTIATIASLEERRQSRATRSAG
jgi:diguanylate cyclase (GGDEF)-like protein